MNTDFIPELASFLLKSNSLQFGIFRLTSGKESPYYIDLRNDSQLSEAFQTYNRRPKRYYSSKNRS